MNQQGIFKNRRGTIILHLFFVFASAWSIIHALNFQGGLGAFPDYIHGWTQSDRYAIAVNYAKSQPNLFYPGALNLNPGLENVSTNDSGISAMDLPLAEYISSCLMRLAGNQSPAWSRLVQILFACLGLYALFRMLLEMGAGIVSLFPVFMLLGSPVWLFYATGFIPSIPAISLALIGCYYFFARNRYILGIVLAALAALVRMPLLIVLISMLISLLPERAQYKKLFLGVGFGILVYLPWSLWKIHLQNTYGSMFLVRLMPAGSWNELLELSSESISKWWTHLFSIPVWILSGLMLIAAPFLGGNLFRNKLLLAGWAGMAGGLIYFMLMVAQFIHHDYYYLDAFFVPLLLVLSGISIKLNAIVNKRRRVYAISFILLSLFMSQTKLLNQVLAERVETGPWDRYHLTLENFKGGGSLLDSLGIPTDAPILVIDAYSTNAPLLLLNRRGYTILNTVPEELKKAAYIPVQYAVIQDVFLRSDVVRSLPEIINDWERIGGNGRISVFKRSKSIRSEMEFAGISACEVIYEGIKSGDENWKNLTPTGDSALIIHDIYGPTFKLKATPGEKVIFWADFEFTAEQELPGIELVFKMHQGDKIKVRQFSLNDYSTSLHQYRFNCMVPFDTGKEPAELEFFIYNPQALEAQVKIPVFKVFEDRCRD